MRFCTACRRVTPGEPLFCGFCARTYNVRLCPRQHPNPRWAQACSECGSRELTTPMRPVSFGLRFTLVLLRITPAALLLTLTIGVGAALFYSLWHDLQFQAEVMCAAAGLVVLWVFYLLLPPSLQRPLAWTARTSVRATGFVVSQRGKRRGRPRKEG